MASYALIHLFSPLGLVLALLLLSLFCFSYKKLSKSLIILAIFGLYSSSTPYFAYIYHQAVFDEAALPPFNKNTLTYDKAHTAIVVLGGGRYPQAREYGGTDVLSASAMDRVRMAVKIQKETGLPILASGAAKKTGQRPEAKMMQDELQSNFNITKVWLETESKTTAENAKFSAVILKVKQIDTVILVTALSHMARAQRVFLQTGLAVIPAPTRYYNRPTKEKRWWPTTFALQRTSSAWYEFLAQIWYKIST